MNRQKALSLLTLNQIHPPLMKLLPKKKRFLQTPKTPNGSRIPSQCNTMTKNRARINIYQKLDKKLKLAHTESHTNIKLRAKNK